MTCLATIQYLLRVQLSVQSVELIPVTVCLRGVCLHMWYIRTGLQVRSWDLFRWYYKDELSAEQSLHSVLSPACVSLSPSALTELSQCDSIENVPRFQTLRFNVQAHQSRPVIYWLQLGLCIHIRTVAAALESQRAALQQDILAQGESLEARWPRCWEEIRRGNAY